MPLPYFRALLTAAALCLGISASAQPEPGRRVMFIHAGLIGASPFTPYASHPLVSEVKTVGIPLDPLHMDHEKIYQHVMDEYESFARDGDVVLVGYSIGAKFAARLAAEKQGIRGLFLMDPVDGGAPVPVLSRIFQLFVRAGSLEISVPTFILRSEFGERPGVLGLPCVPPSRGAAHFSGAVRPEMLHTRFVPGAGHLDFLARPFPPAFWISSAFACAPGSRPPEEVLDLARSDWNGFLTGTFQPPL